MRVLKNLLLLFGIAMMTFSVMSCNDDSPTPTPNPTPTPTPTPTASDAVYVTGSNTIASDTSEDAATLELAVLDPGKGAMEESLNGFYGKFMYIGANSTIEITTVVDGETTVYGSPNGGAIDSSINVGGAINDLVINGSLVSGSDPIAVDAAGLYYLFADLNDKTFILSPVKANIIGDATSGQWTTQTEIPLKSTNASTTVFEITDLPLFGNSGYRYRFNDGWHFYNGTEAVTLSSLGVPNYGDAYAAGVNDVGYYLDNIPNVEEGLFTITLIFDATTGEWEETKTRTGDLTVDYSTVEFGLFGNAYYVTGTVEGAWDAIHHTSLPTVQGSVYTWTWTQELIANRAFVIRENIANGEWVTFNTVTRDGSAFTNDLIIQEANSENFFVVIGDIYDITFSINTDTDERKVTIEPN